MEILVYGVYNRLRLVETLKSKVQLSPFLFVFYVKSAEKYKRIIFFNLIEIIAKKITFAILFFDRYIIRFYSLITLHADGIININHFWK